MRLSLSNAGIALGALACTLVLWFGIRHFSRPSADEAYKPFYTAGFDFRFQQEHVLFSKYKPGMRIEIERLVLGVDDRGLAGQGLPTLLLVTNPTCAFVKRSSDISVRLHEYIKQYSVPVRYLPAIFVEKNPNTDLRAHARELGFDDYVVWNTAEVPPQILGEIPTPAYFLVDKRGVILRVWFSSSPLEHVRRRMADQMIHDLKVITETIYSQDSGETVLR